MVSFRFITLSLGLHSSSLLLGFPGQTHRDTLSAPMCLYIEPLTYGTVISWVSAPASSTCTVILYTSAEAAGATRVTTPAAKL